MDMKKSEYVRPELEVILIASDGDILGDSQGGVGEEDSNSKHGFGTFDLEDDIAEDMDY